MNTQKKTSKRDELFITPDDLNALKTYRDAKSSAHEIAEKEFIVLDRIVTKIEQQNK